MVVDAICVVYSTVLKLNRMLTMLLFRVYHIVVNLIGKNIEIRDAQ